MKVDNIAVVTPFPPVRRDHVGRNTITVEEAFTDLISVISATTATVELQEALGFGQTFGGIPAGKWQGLGVRCTRVVVPEGVPQALNQLYYAIEERLMIEYKAGIQEGTHVLRRLANGTLALDDISSINSRS